MSSQVNLKSQPYNNLGGDATKISKETQTVLLVGNTNVGKSTLFNGVTGAHQAMINAPGTTVEVMAGKWRTLGVRILDLPGTYSLIPTSPDEEVVEETIAGRPGTLTDPSQGHHTDLVLAILDGSSLTRSLYLLGQIAQTGHPVAALISLADVAQHHGVEIDPSALSKELGIPVMIFDARKPKLYPVLDEFVRNALEAPSYIRGLQPDPEAPGYCEEAAQHGHAQCKTPRNCCGSVTIDERNLLAQTLCGCANELVPGEDCAKEGTRNACGCGHAPASSLKLNDETAALLNADESEAQLERAKTLFAWVDKVESAVLKHREDPTKLSRSDQADRILLNPFFGTAVFFGLMWTLFHLAGEWVSPLQDMFDGWFSSTDDGEISLANGVVWVLTQLSLDGTWVQSLLVNGLATGLGVVASFVPLMFVIFVAISVLEDSGYMARAAFLADRLMRKIGLDGRVVLPLIMGFGCNLPSLAAARSLPSARHRLITAIITPYTSCSARLTIYLMIAKIFFPNNTGTVVFVMYVLSVTMVVLAAWVLKFFFTRSESQAPLMLILPSFQLPRVLVLGKISVQRTFTFVRGAGKIIVTMAMLVWLLGAIPTSSSGEHGFADPELPMSESAYGLVARGLEPVFAPAGFGDWHMTGALMTGFVAKETVVSSIVVSYNMDAEAAGDAEDNGDDLGVLPNLLGETFKQTAGAGLEQLAALAFLVFVLTYTPCMATVGEQVRLIGGKLTSIAVGVQLVVAWLLAVGVFQIGKLFLG
ncbi:ferrous iron transport protein B [Arcanobacterium pluranimalium]|uniref:ferrous iron transport protein B n=1 Tax=Arcanobacterium pluranimalium TaxID=108028 RepID=UPI001EF7BDB7|nr:ferrous iron transport protein B [Arcanobacterium pluranimalium]MBM7824179.1 ferrous iron transport protein B [Arcanobacterium pluranimalium]